MSFSLFFSNGNSGRDCDRLNEETSLTSNSIPIGTHGNLRLRGHSLEMDQAVLLQRNIQQEFNYTLCASQLPEFYGSK